MSNKLFTEFVGASPNARLEKSTPFDFMSEVDKPSNATHQMYPTQKTEQKDTEQQERHFLT